MLNLVYNFKHRTGERRWGREGGREKGKRQEGRKKEGDAYNMFYCLTGELESRSCENSRKVQDNELAS